MRQRRLMPLATAVFLAASCTSKDAGTAGSRGEAAPGDSVVERPRLSWFDGTEPLLLAPAHSNDRALVVMADSLAPDLDDGPLQLPGTLVRLDGTLLPVGISISAGSEGCVDAALQPAPSTAWGVGFVGQPPESIQVDSIRAIARQDSAALAPVIFRLASSVQNTPGGRFAGLPFTLVDLWRMKTQGGTTVVVATTKRQINQEDSPLEERTLLVAEADAAGGFNRVYATRSAGLEETVEGSELLAAVSFGRATQLVFSHDFGQEVSYSIVERSPNGAWALRWVSRRFSC